MALLQVQHATLVVASDLFSGRELSWHLLSKVKDNSHLKEVEMWEVYQTIKLSHWKLSKAMVSNKLDSSFWDLTLRSPTYLSWLKMKYQGIGVNRFKTSMQSLCFKILTNLANYSPWIKKQEGNRRTNLSQRMICPCNAQPQQQRWSRKAILRMHSTWTMNPDTLWFDKY